jgi:hypothetical protein
VACSIRSRPPVSLAGLQSSGLRLRVGDDGWSRSSDGPCRRSRSFVLADVSTRGQSRCGPRRWSICVQVGGVDGPGIWVSAGSGRLGGCKRPGVGGCRVGCVPVVAAPERVGPCAGRGTCRPSGGWVRDRFRCVGRARLGGPLVRAPDPGRLVHPPAPSRGRAFRSDVGVTSVPVSARGDRAAASGRFGRGAVHDDGCRGGGVEHLAGGDPHPGSGSVPLVGGSDGDDPGHSPGPSPGAGAAS